MAVAAQPNVHLKPNALNGKVICTSVRGIAHIYNQLSYIQKIGDMNVVHNSLDNCSG